MAHLGKILTKAPCTLRSLLFTADEKNSTLFRLNGNIPVEPRAEGFQGKELCPAMTDHPVGGMLVPGADLDADVAEDSSRSEVGLSAGSRIRRPVPGRIITHIITHLNCPARENVDIPGHGLFGTHVSDTGPRSTKGRVGKGGVGSIIEIGNGIRCREEPLKVRVTIQACTCHRGAFGRHPVTNLDVTVEGFGIHCRVVRKCLGGAVDHTGIPLCRRPRPRKLVKAKQADCSRGRSHCHIPGLLLIPDARSVDTATTAVTDLGESSAPASSAELNPRSGETTTISGDGRPMGHDRNIAVQTGRLPVATVSDQGKIATALIRGRKVGIAGGCLEPAGSRD